MIAVILGRTRYGITEHDLSDKPNLRSHLVGQGWEPREFTLTGPKGAVYSGLRASEGQWMRASLTGSARFFERDEVREVAA